MSLTCTLNLTVWQWLSLQHCSVKCAAWVSAGAADAEFIVVGLMIKMQRTKLLTAWSCNVRARLYKQALCTLANKATKYVTWGNRWFKLMQGTTALGATVCSLCWITALLLLLLLHHGQILHHQTQGGSHQEHQPAQQFTLAGPETAAKDTRQKDTSTRQAPLFSKASL